jgi:outer membrane protein assembly factor BamB
MRYNLLRYPIAIYFIGFCLISCHKAPETLSNNQGNNNQQSSFGIVYYQNNGNVAALDIDKGGRLWEISYPYADDLNGMVYDSGVLYLGDIYGIAAIDAKIGSVLWNTPLTSQGFRFGSPTAIEDRPVISDSLIYIVSVSQKSNYADHPTLYCLNKKTGGVRWSQDLVGYGNSPAWIFSTPVIVGNKIIALAHCDDPTALSNTVYCFDKITGTQIWNNNSVFYGTLNYLNSYPFSPDNSQVIFISNHSNIVSLDANTGAVSWTSNLPIATPRNVTPVSKNGLLYLYDGHNFLNFNLATKQPEQVVKDSVSTETISGNSVYTIKGFSHIIAGRTIANYSNPVWKWVSPAKRYYDTVITDPSAHNIYFGNLSYCYYSNITTDGAIVYYYENVFDRFFSWKRDQVLNSLFMIDAKTGLLLKELPINFFNSVYPNSKLGSYDSLLGRNLIIVKNNNVYYPFNN